MQPADLSTSELNRVQEYWRGLITPDSYELGSPASHVHPGGPPTLLFHGARDVLVPVDSTCALHAKLVEVGVPAINVVFPQTAHAFDLTLPQINPAAQSALYDVDRFLALLLNKDERSKRGEFAALATSDAAQGP